MASKYGEDVAVLKIEMKELKMDVKELKSEMHQGFEKIEAKMDAQDNKYASKTVEKIVYALIGVIILYVINLWLGLIKLPTVVVPGTTDTTRIIESGSAPATNSPTTSSGGSVPAAKAEANAQAGKEKDSETSESGGVQVTLPKAGL